jgi:hypothetical protein
VTTTMRNLEYILQPQIHVAIDNTFCIFLNNYINILLYQSPTKIFILH